MTITAQQRTLPSYDHLESKKKRSSHPIFYILLADDAPDPKFLTLSLVSSPYPALSINFVNVVCPESAVMRFSLMPGARGGSRKEGAGIRTSIVSEETSVGVRWDLECAWEWECE